MKRILVAALSTVSAVVLLFGYRTSTSGALSSSATAPFESTTTSGGSSASSGSSTASGSGSAGGGRGTSGSGSGAASGSGSSSGGTGSGGTGSGGTGSGGTGSGGTGSGGSSAAATTTATGAVADTQWGPVQVRLTLLSGTITKVSVLQYPNGNSTDAQINDYALPVLIQETVDAQNASIDMVSGATVTSTGYLQSLQSALDQAGI